MRRIPFSFIGIGTAKYIQEIKTKFKYVMYTPYDTNKWQNKMSKYIYKDLNATYL